MSTLRSSQFIPRALVGILLLVAAVIGVDYWLDGFGMFRSSAGRSIGIYAYERLSKYLLMQRYVPENFDGLLLGASGSDVLDTNLLKSARIYNGSLLDADASELDSLVDSAIGNGKLKLVIFSMRAHMLKGKPPLASPRGRELTLEGLASDTLFANLFLRWETALLGRPGAEFDGSGDCQRPAPRNPGQAEGEIRLRMLYREDQMRDGAYWDIDPNSVQHLKALVEKIRERGLRIITYYPPVPAEIYALRREAIRDYRGRINSLFTDREPVLDFNEGCLAALAADHRNFWDADHVSAAGGAALVRVVDEVVAGRRYRCPQPGRSSEIELARRVDSRNAIGYLRSKAARQARMGRFDQAVLSIEAAQRIAAEVSPQALPELQAKGREYETLPSHFRTASVVEINRGYRAKRRGDAAEAERHFRLALELEEREPERLEDVMEGAHQNLGILFVESHRLEEAKHHYLEAIKARPDRAINHDNLGSLLKAMGQIEGAAAAFTEAAKLGFTPPDDSYLVVADELFRRGNPTKASELLTWLARAYRHQQRVQAAEAVTSFLQARLGGRVPANQ